MRKAVSPIDLSLGRLIHLIKYIKYAYRNLSLPSDVCFLKIKVSEIADSTRSTVPLCGQLKNILPRRALFSSINTIRFINCQPTWSFTSASPSLPI
ncbi:hypothetical protein LMH87_004356 [Akanthomyces muscarius]|uniref:Uncharacterized protein n=1 Tax=Akanthomyces muscarius TaxID=2231603 RepID=A0A9W8Q349_AKAMU|nr:hypothetical protein LMH87_004356 [Akanthomyces muscarius]KAJ4145508.1 hypothetical protein LMH87_004356 [Akanthomyces muscarius]